MNFIGKKDYFCADVWMDKINQIKSTHFESKNQAYEWALEARQRQEKETENLIVFLDEVIASK